MKSIPCCCLGSSSSSVFTDSWDCLFLLLVLLCNFFSLPHHSSILFLSIFFRLNTVTAVKPPRQWSVLPADKRLSWGHGTEGPCRGGAQRGSASSQHHATGRPVPLGCQLLLPEDPTLQPFQQPPVPVQVPGTLPPLRRLVLFLIHTDVCVWHYCSVLCAVVLHWKQGS